MTSSHAWLVILFGLIVGLLTAKVVQSVSNYFDEKAALAKAQRELLTRVNSVDPSLVEASGNEIDTSQRIQERLAREAERKDSRR